MRHETVGEIAGGAERTVNASGGRERGFASSEEDATRAISAAADGRRTLRV